MKKKKRYTLFQRFTKLPSCFNEPLGAEVVLEGGIRSSQGLVGDCYPKSFLIDQLFLSNRLCGEKAYQPVCWFCAPLV